MPRYQYRCTECEELSTINHESSEVEVECPKCSDPHGLVKLMTRFTRPRPAKIGKKAGNLTEDFIKDSREQLEQQRKDLNKNR